MWTPLSAWRSWGSSSNRAATENARVAAVACSRARLERVEVELYLAEVAARRMRPSVPA